MKASYLDTFAKLPVWSVGGQGGVINLQRVPGSSAENKPLKHSQNTGENGVRSHCLSQSSMRFPRPPLQKGAMKRFPHNVLDFFFSTWSFLRDPLLVTCVSPRQEDPSPLKCAGVRWLSCQALSSHLKNLKKKKRVYYNDLCVRVKTCATVLS